MYRWSHKQMLLLTAPYNNLHHSDSTLSRLHKELPQVGSCWFQQRSIQHMTIQQRQDTVSKPKNQFMPQTFNHHKNGETTPLLSISYYKFLHQITQFLKRPRKLTETKEILHCFHTVRPVPHSWPHHGNRASGLINDVGAGETDEEQRFRP